SSVPPPPKPTRAPKPVHEVDLSDEWASLLEQQAGPEPAAAPPPPPAPPPLVASLATASVKDVAAAPPKPSPATQEFSISEFEIPVEGVEAEKPIVASPV